MTWFLASPLATGFDFPVGDADGKGAYVDAATGVKHEGWYRATVFAEKYALGIHPGEDWNGRGGGNTDLGQPVYAIGAGTVIAAADFPAPWGKIIVLQHKFKEGSTTRTVRSLYAHLGAIDVKKGDVVTGRQKIGAIGRDPGKTYPAHLHFEIRTDLDIAPSYWPSSNGDDLEAVRKRYVDPTKFIEARRKL